jgi:hypothetical protein
MLRFGSPRNTDAGCGERALKVFAKKPSETAQKRESVFLEQLTHRLHENEILAKMNRILDPLGDVSSHTNDSANKTFDSSDHDIIKEHTSIHDMHISLSSEYSSDSMSTKTTLDSILAGVLVGKPKFRVSVLDNQTTVYIVGKKRTKGLVCLHPLVVQWFLKSIPSQGVEAQTDFLVWTEFKLSDSMRLRAHPNYRSRGNWNDWCFAQIPYAKSQSKSKKSRSQRYQSIECPVKILGFYQKQSDSAPCSDTFAIVHACLEHAESSDSVLCEIWHLEYNYAISKTTECIPRF